MLGSHSFHFLADPEELIEQVKQLLVLRREACISARPFMLWEPRPSSCRLSNLNAMFMAVREVDVFSPNHVELFAAFGKPVPAPFDASSVEQLALPFKTSGIGPTGQGCVVIRAGENGCFIASTTQAPTWLPAYYEPFKGTNIAATTPIKNPVDPTGAGNAFLGAFAIGSLDTCSVFDAACYGAVGSSFAVEQIGLPNLTNVNGEELWNGENAFARLEEYRTRLKR